MYFLEQRLSSKVKQKWVIRILGDDFELIYKKGNGRYKLKERGRSIGFTICYFLSTIWLGERRKDGIEHEIDGTNMP